MIRPMHKISWMGVGLLALLVFPAGPPRMCPAENVPQEDPPHPRSLTDASSDATREETLSPAQSTENPLLFRAALSRSVYGPRPNHRLLLKVDLEGRLRAPSPRPPLNLALVIDRSGSMAREQRFMHAIQAAHLAVENLSPKDIVSLIAFDAKARVLSPAGPAVNKNFLRYRLGQIPAEGWTNLSAGLLEAFSQIDSRSEEGQRKHVILLTDGEANRGVVSVRRLERMVREARKRGIGLSTLGCGTGYNEKLLTTLAKAGGGRFTYMRSSDDIADAMAKELNGLLEVVAQNTAIRFAAAPGTLISRVFGRLPGDRGTSYEVDLGDIRDGEKSVFLLELEPRRFVSGATAGADVHLQWDNPDTGKRRHEVIRMTASFSNDALKSIAEENRGILLYAGVLDALERAEEAIQGLDTERFQEVHWSFERLYDQARTYAVETRDQELLNQTFMLKHFMSELSAIERRGLLHGHREARNRIRKEVGYRRYLMDHHRPVGR